jgi:hypothetical protein
MDATRPTNRTLEQPYRAGANYTSVLDGFLISPNVEVPDVTTIDLGFAHGDHNPVRAILRKRVGPPGQTGTGAATGGGLTSGAASAAGAVALPRLHVLEVPLSLERHHERLHPARLARTVQEVARRPRRLRFASGRGDPSRGGPVRARERAPLLFLRLLDAEVEEGLKACVTCCECSTRSLV